MTVPGKLRHPPTPKSEEWRDGTKPLIGAIAGYASGFGILFFSANLLIGPLRTEFHWNAVEATFLPVTTIVVAIFFPISGTLVERFGARRVALTGLAGLTCCFAALSRLPDSVFCLRTLSVLMGVFAGLAGAVTFGKGIATWFDRYLGTALGLTMSGATLGGVFGVPLIAWTITSYGWRDAWLLMAVISGVVGVPATLLFFRGKTESRPQLVPSNVHQVAPRQRVPWSDFRFICLALASVCVAAAIGIFLNQLSPILASRGFVGREIAILGSLFAASTFSGRIAAGHLLDRFSDLVVATTCFALSAAGASIFAFASAGHNVSTGGGLILIGLSYGAEADFAAYFAIRFFGLERFPTIFGILSMFIALAMASGGIASAWMFDKTGTFELPLLVAPFGFAAGAALLIAIWKHLGGPASAAKEGLLQ
jgi:MFS transporter, OFA family, oxalate/formate antiporter